MFPLMGTCVILIHDIMPSAKFEIKRKCKECGATFIAKTLESYYCSRTCTLRAYNKRKKESKKKEQMDAIVSKIPDGRDYISVTEAEAMFGISAKTIRRMIRSGKIPAINIGQRLTRVCKSALLERVPLRDEPLDRTKPLPKLYHLEPEDCYTIGEISKTYGIDDSTVYAHIRKYSIPTRQIGNFVYAPKEDIDHLYKDVVKS